MFGLKQENKTPEERVSSLTLHFKWGCGVATLVIIWIASLAFSKDPDLVSHISFASALASIILALVAIFYSMIHGTRTQRNVGELESLVKQASEVMDVKTEKLGYTATQLEDSIRTLTQSTVDRDNPELEDKGEGTIFHFNIRNISPAGASVLYWLSLHKNKKINLMACANIIAGTTDTPALSESVRSWSAFIHCTVLTFACFLKTEEISVDQSGIMVRELPNDFDEYCLSNIKKRISFYKQSQQELHMLNFLERIIPQLEELARQ